MTLGVVWGDDKIGLAPEYPFQTNSEASNLKKDNLTTAEHGRLLGCTITTYVSAEGNKTIYLCHEMTWGQIIKDALQKVVLEDYYPLCEVLICYKKYFVHTEKFFYDMLILNYLENEVLLNIQNYIQSKWEEKEKERTGKEVQWHNCPNEM